jgi:hypothetical protein
MATKIPAHEELTYRRKVKVNGFEGRIRRQYDGEMYEVILERGEVCVDRSEITLVD